MDRFAVAVAVFVVVVCLVDSEVTKPPSPMYYYVACGQNLRQSGRSPLLKCQVHLPCGVPSTSEHKRRSFRTHITFDDARRSLR